MLEAVERDGFAIVRNAVDPDACNRLLRALAAPEVRRSRAGARHLLSNPIIRRLATASVLQEMASGVLRSQAIPFRATLFDKSASSNFYAHAPAAALERVVALRLHLDDSAETNGPLRVVAATHKLGVLSDDAVSVIAHERPAATCVIEKGGVVVMRPLLIHSSSKTLSDAPRRVLHIEYAEDSLIAPGVALAVV